MRYPIILTLGLLALPLLSYSQDCDYIKNTPDSIVLKTIRLGTDSTRFRVVATMMSFYGIGVISITTNYPMGCVIPHKSHIVIKYKSGLTREIHHFGRKDCRQQPNFLLTLTPSVKKEFLTEELDEIYMSYSEGSINFFIYDNQKSVFKENIPCIETDQ